MKSLRDYITEAEAWVDEPVQGDSFSINIREECLIETHIVDVMEDGVVLHGDERMLELLEGYGYEMEEIRRYGAVGNNNAMGYTNEAQDDEHPAQAMSRREQGDAAQQKIDRPAVQRKASGNPDWKVTLTDLYRARQRHDSEHLRRLKELAGMQKEDANSNDPLLAKSVDDAAVPALEEDSDSRDAVASAITNRIMKAHLDVLAKHGPARVIAAIDDVADSVGSVDEIGTSDTSIWTRQVLQALEAGEYDSIREEVTTSEPMPQQGAVANEPADPLNPPHEIDEDRLPVTHDDPLVTVHDRDGLHSHANLSVVNRIFHTNVDADDVHRGPVRVRSGWDDKRPLLFQLSKHHESEVEKDLDEAEYQGREVPLGKPMAGDVKKKKVYVRKPNGNVVKVEFGDPNMRIKKHIPGRRKNFRARHNCDNPGPRWKARYWSCRAW